MNTGGSLGIRRREAASISLFLASVLAALLLVNIIVLAGGKSLLLQTQAAMRLEQECERALSSYDESLFRDFGLWGMAEGLGEQLNKSDDVLRARSELEGLKELRFNLSEPLYTEKNFRVQIMNFMQPRFPFALAERLLLQMRELQRGTDGKTLQDFKADLGKTHIADGMKAFGSLLLGREQIVSDPTRDESGQSELDEAGKAASTPPHDAARPTFLSSAGLPTALLDSFQDALREELAAPLELYTAGELGLDKPALLLNKLSEAERLFHYEGSGFYERLALNEYALRMFPSQIKNVSEYPFSQNLRARVLPPYDENSRNSCEYILTGKNGEAQKAEIKLKIQLSRFLLQLGGLLSNAEKMRTYQQAGRAISLLIMAVSLGKANIPAEAISYTLITAKSALEARKDTLKLLEGKAIPLIPYSSIKTLSGYYHDYLRFFFILLPEKTVLERCAAAIENYTQQRFYTEVKLELLWQNPYFNQSQEKFLQNRRYAVYGVGLATTN